MTTLLILVPLKYFIKLFYKILQKIWKYRLGLFIPIAILGMVYYSIQTPSTTSHPELLLRAMKVRNADLICEQYSPNTLLIMKTFGEDCPKLFTRLFKNPSYPELFDYKRLVTYKDDQINVELYVTFSRLLSNSEQVIESLLMFELNKEGFIDNVN